MLEVSDPAISADYIQDFSPEERFIRLPIANFIKLNEIELIRPQTALVNAINNPKYRAISAILSRRSGKTFIVNLVGLAVVLNPGSRILLIAPNYSLAQISWNLQQQFIRKFQLETTINNAKDKVIELDNPNEKGERSAIRMGSVGQVDSVIGYSYDLIIFDEAAIDPNGEKAYEVQLRPTLDKKNLLGQTVSKTVFITTPRGHNYMYKFFNRGFDPSFEDWVSIRSDYTENPRVTEKDIQAAKRELSNDNFRQEYLSEFISKEGQVYHVTNDQLLDSVPKDFILEDVIIGVDLGYRDPTFIAVIKIGYFPEPKVFNKSTNYKIPAGEFVAIVVDEYEKAALSTSMHAKALKGFMDKYDTDLIIIDHSMAQTRQDLAYTYNIPTHAAKKAVEPGIAYVAKLIDQGRLLCLSSCERMIACISNYSWSNSINANNEHTKERPRHNEFSHGADALRYPLYTYSYNIEG